MLRKFLFVSLAVVTLASCKKDKDENNQIAITKENLLGTYTVKSMESKVNGMVLPDQREACEKDDLTILKAANVYELKEGSLACDPPSDETGTWDLQGKSLIIDGDAEGTISSLTSNELVIEDSGTDQGISWSIKVVLSKK